MGSSLSESPQEGKQEENGKESEGSRGEGASPPAGGEISLPCLYSNNSIEIDNKSSPDETINKLCPYHKKQAEVLFQNTKRFIDMHGLERVGFLTLTFKDNVRCNKEAGRRFNSLSTNFLSVHFGEWMLVKERQKRGAWHYHLLIDCGTDIRTDFDFEGIKSGNYSSASRELKQYWTTLRKGLPKYGFGRSELLPVMSNSEGLARYVGKYISKHVGSRSAEDKGVRLFSCSKGFRVANTHFAWNSIGSWIWRMKLKEFARSFGIKNYDDLKVRFGDRWAWDWALIIEEVKLPRSTIYPTIKHWQTAENLPDFAIPFEIPLELVNQDRIINIRVHRLQKSRLTAKDWEVITVEEGAALAEHQKTPQKPKPNMLWAV